MIHFNLLRYVQVIICSSCMSKYREVDIWDMAGSSALPYDRRYIKCRHSSSRNYSGPLCVPWHKFTGPHEQWGLRWQGVELRWEQDQLLSNVREWLVVCTVMCSSCTNWKEIRRTNYNCSFFWASLSCHSCAVTASGHTRFVRNDVSNKVQLKCKSVHCFQFILLWPNVPLLSSRNSAVGIETGYGLDDRGVGNRVTVGSRIFSSSRHSNRLWGPPRLVSNGYWMLFPLW
jgi:hypothetical protein